MFMQKFVLRAAGILATALIVSLTTGDICRSEEKKDTDKKKGTFTEAQLQSHLMSFADRFVSILDITIAEFEALQPTGKTRYEILEMMTFSAHHAYIIAGGSDPGVGLLDMLSMVTLGRIFFEEEGEQRYGSYAAPVLKGYLKAEADIRNVGANILSPEQVNSLMTIIRNWRKRNPEVKNFPLIRFSNFAADRQEKTLSRGDTPEGLFESVESASETVEEMRLLAERSVYMGTRMPQLIGLFGDLWLTRWMNTPDVQKTLAELTILSQGAGRLAVTAEDIAGRLTQERDATLKLIKAYVSQERDQAVKQLIDGVSAQRRALLREILAEERLFENRLLDQVSVIVDQQGRQLIDYAMRQLAILVVVGLTGYVVAILIFRFASNKFDIFKKVS
jgi:hypothetical protein